MGADRQDRRSSRTDPDLGPDEPLPTSVDPGLPRPGRIDEPLSLHRSTELAAGFKALADPVRLRVLSLIASHDGGEACVCDLVGAFDLSQPTISHHLRVLRAAGLVESERRGTWVYYRACREAIAALTPALGVDAVLF